MADTHTLQVERIIPGPIDAVFDAWLDAKQLERFMTPGPGMTVPRASVDPKVGGRFHLTMKAGDREIPHDGEYRVIDRPHQLVFTWVSQPAGHTLVTVDFRRLSDRSTRVVLRHERLVTADSRSGHEKGWSAILEALERAVA